MPPSVAVKVYQDTVPHWVVFQTYLDLTDIAYASPEGEQLLASLNVESGTNKLRIRTVPPTYSKP